MYIKRFIVYIGDQRHELLADQADSRDIGALLVLATSRELELKIKIPHSPKALEVLNRYQEKISENHKELTSDTLDEEHLAQLSKDLASFDLSLSAFHALDRAGYQYVWQIATMPEKRIRKIKNVGKKVATDILETLERHGLKAGMDLSAVMTHLRWKTTFQSSTA